MSPPVSRPYPTRSPPSVWQNPEFPIILLLGFSLCALGLASVIVYYSYIIEKGIDWGIAHFGTEFYYFIILGTALLVIGSVFLGMYFYRVEERKRESEQLKREEQMLEDVRKRERERRQREVQKITKMKKEILAMIDWASEDCLSQEDNI